MDNKDVLDLYGSLRVTWLYRVGQKNGTKFLYANNSIKY